MAFILKRGKTCIRWLPVTTSTALSADSLVAFSSGYLVAATSTTAGSATAGVLLKAITSSDSDYATARLVAVQVPLEADVQWEADVTSGLAATSIGAFYDLTDAVTVATTGSTYDIVRCVKYISTTKGWFNLNIGVFAIAGK